MPAPWKKSPAALVERFAAALPAYPDLVRRPMFGYPAAFVNGNMVCGLFRDSVVVRLGKEGAAAVTAANQAKQFAPMPGRAMTGYVVLPDADVENRTALAAWLQHALEYTLTLETKTPKGAASKGAKRRKR
jgi:hypothetical protein